MIKWYAFQRAASVGLAVLTAVIIGSYLPPHESAWLILTTFLVSQTTQGTRLRQALSFLLLIMLAVIAAFLLSMLGKLVTEIILAMSFITTAYIAYRNRPISNKLFFHLTLFVVVLLIASFAPTHAAPLPEQIAGIILGAVIAALFNHFVLPIKLDAVFFRGVVPILQVLRRYSDELKDAAATSGDHSARLENMKIQVENALLYQQGRYPEWVYETGFNPGLRSSWRFILINIERMTEIYFSLDYLLLRGIHKSAGTTVALVLHHNAELLNILIQYFSERKHQKTESDYTSDMTELETMFQHIVPQDIDLIDLTPEYLTLTALVRDLRDLRAVLLQLVLALPEK